MSAAVAVMTAEELCRFHGWERRRFKLVPTVREPEPMPAPAPRQDYAQMGRIGGYRCKASHPREWYVENGRKAVEKRWANQPDPQAAMHAHMAKMTQASARARSARSGTRMK